MIVTLMARMAAPAAGPQPVEQPVREHAERLRRAHEILGAIDEFLSAVELPIERLMVNDGSARGVHALHPL